MAESEPLLRVENLVTSFQTEHGKVTPVDRISFSVERGKTLAIVGESGSGKSVTALSIMGLIPRGNGQIEGGKVLLEGTNLLGLSDREMGKVRGNRVAMIFQEPMTALNPVFTIGTQMREVYKLHQNLSRADSTAKCLEMLKKVRISDPEQCLDKYPHQLSGGMRQRVMIAMALSCNPALLIADEPTTALDVTIQAQVLRLMKELQEELGTAIIFITHDLGVVAQVADDVMVMYCGRACEKASVYDIFDNGLHPYTQGLIGSLPRLDDSREDSLRTIEGLVPSLRDLPKGCRFASRCGKVKPECETSLPELMAHNDTHTVACPVVLAEDGAA